MKTITIQVNSRELDNIIAALRRYGADCYNDCSKEEWNELCQLTKRLNDLSK